MGVFQAGGIVVLLLRVLLALPVGLLGANFCGRVLCGDAGVSGLLFLWSGGIVRPASGVF